MSWNTTCVGDVCKYTTSGGTPRTSVASYYEPPTVPWLKTKEVNYCRIYQTESYISQEGLDNSSAKLIPENSVIVAMYGQGDTAGRVAINKIPVSTNQACCNLIIDPEKADYEFVYYALSTLYEKLVSLKNGGAQPNLNAQIIRSVEIPFPPLETQHKIAAFLSAYDDLIENNQKQIKLLEEVAQRLYKEWFVDLHFPGHETTPIVDGVPEGWAWGTLADIALFRRGKTITKDQVKAGIIPVVAGGLEPAYYHDTPNTNVPVVTVSGSGANAGFTRMYHTKVWASDCSYIDAAVTKNTAWVYCFLKGNKASIDAMQKGAAQPHVYAKDLNAMKALFPDDKLLEQFRVIADPMFTRIGKLDMQIKRLAEARDRLLPKLMSGEIEV